MCDLGIKLPIEHHLEFLSLKEAALACLSLHVSKRHIVGNHTSRLNLVTALTQNL